MHFQDDHYGHVDTSDFYRHCQNTARVVDPYSALAKLFVLPMETLPGGISRVRFLLVAAHQISEGLTMYSWMSHFLSLLNTPDSELSASLPKLLEPESFQKRLPLPQEDHYPPIRGTRARQRWFWTLTLILRHIRKPLPPAFPNPLRRLIPRPHATPMSPTYDKTLNYNRTPPLNSFACQSILSPSTTARLHRLCREAGVSIGSGCFALCGMVMMELEEARHPYTPAASRKPFIGSFPLNPRQFFNHHAAPDSLMLAFSDGLVLPFLSSDLDPEGRFRLLARSAHRQLRIYQKRLRKEDEAKLGARSPGRVIATNYIAAVERAEAKLPPQLRTGVNPQGAYPANVNFSGATCGVSSVGRTDAMLKQGTYSLDGKEAVEKRFAADFRSLDMGVRVRDDEFLIGIGGSAEHVFVNVSYDANAIDEVRVEEWRRRMEGVLEGGETARL
ncbi:hypothetical protein B0A49_09310 [Cryomyces minteri]|uniref:Condensation domain-containing protein n=1 Tax=Cryomyces minteri TaxID=331657 RepID=A0A4U0WSQ5_9PEZI|nr:hypothetical protein B0A49_09310 [Cryomyces minteri]